MKYETQLDCDGSPVAVTVYDDGALELDGYDEAYDKAAQEFGYEESVCGQLVRIWQDDSRSQAKADVVCKIFIKEADPCIYLAIDIIRYAMSLLPNYDDPAIVGIEDIKHSAGDVLDYMVEILEERRSPTGSPRLSDSTVRVYLRQQERIFLDFYSSHRWQLEKLRSDEEAAERPAVSQFLDSMGMLCRGVHEIARIPDQAGWTEYVVDNVSSAISRALWSITFSRNKRRFEDYNETVVWFIRRFIKFMNNGARP